MSEIHLILAMEYFPYKQYVETGGISMLIFGSDNTTQYNTLIFDHTPFCSVFSEFT